MLIKVFNLLLVCLFALLFFIFMQEPFVLDFKKYFTGFKSLDAKNIKSFNIENFLENELIAKTYYRIDQTDYFNNIKIYDKKMSLSADYAKKEKKIVVFNSNVEYKTKDLELKAIEIEYDIDQRILKSFKPISALYNGTVIEAEGLNYELDSGDLRLNEVYVCIEN